jgi:membrane-associated phospholipid phosphatase
MPSPANKTKSDLVIALEEAGATQRQAAVMRMCLWAALAATLIALAFLCDDRVARMVTLAPTSIWQSTAEYASKAGEGWVIAVVGIALSGFLFFQQRFYASRLVFMVGLAGLLSGAAATGLRSLLGRTRPDSPSVQGFYGVWHDSHWIIGQYQFGAFPSGHTATVVGLAMAAWLVDRRFGLVACAYAALVSWSRMAMGCHHFSDVVAATVLGVFCARQILTRLGPGVEMVSGELQTAWLKRRQSYPRSPKRKDA